MVAKRRTPIERHIDGDHQDRRYRYLDRIHKEGLKRVTVTIPADQVDQFQERARNARELFRDRAAKSSSDD